MPYEVHSFDFDGCLANLSYLNHPNKEWNTFLEANKELIYWINLSPLPKKVFIGSSRQAPMIDLFNTYRDKRGSCYLYTQKLSEAIKATFDPFLLADVYNDLRAGTSFKQAIKYLDKKTHHYVEDLGPKCLSFYNWLHDESKLTILYAQMHKVAAKLREEKIYFYFHDDRIDILDALYDYFSKHSELIPPNITLTLIKYDGGMTKEDPLIALYPEIVGTGLAIDEDYRKSIKLIAAATIENMLYHKEFFRGNNPGKPVQSYAEAKAQNFECSSIYCLQYYTPSKPIPQKEGNSLQAQISNPSPPKKKSSLLDSALVNKFRLFHASLKGRNAGVELPEIQASPPPVAKSRLQG